MLMTAQVSLSEHHRISRPALQPCNRAVKKPGKALALECCVHPSKKSQAISRSNARYGEGNAESQDGRKRR